ncbi:hypothetical protein JTE90_011254 [Oedothorax gibbosus]|uniref:Replication termination factor 2 n=1 Tax=Oedothorax gibbosus TaxID=931172 RepID=A0AAV6W1J2_9ARAC|nr:hypothetical protein JTE90_011254 [Oedothorax gibbosus]
MGCDGGTIPRRDELVRQKKKPEQKDKNAENAAKWKHCAITQEPLRKPIVACELGRLYNKEAVIEHILNKEKKSENASHIAKMSDVKELNLTEKADFKQKHHKGDEYIDVNDARYICPVTGLDMNGRQRFHFAWKCGCVFSERAHKEVKTTTCHKCGGPLNASDVIIINGTDEEMEALREKMTERRRLAKLEKKKKRAAVATETSAKKLKVNNGESSSSKVNDGESSSSSPVNGGEIEKPDLKLAVKDKVKPSSSGVRSVNGEGSSKAVDLPEKAKKSYSIAKDPSASSAYKSLFTSHETAKNQQKAHWVTHNPCFY